MSEERHGPERNPRLAGIANDIEARPRNWLVPVVLVLLRERSSYGYELMRRVSGFGFEAINPGTLYRALRRMERDGLCESEWETASGGPARRSYSISDVGEAYLDSWVVSLERYRQSMDAYLRAYGSSGKTGS